MGERDTSAEREAYIRQALAETEARDLDSADNAIADLLAMLDVSRGREHGPCDEIRLRHATDRAERAEAGLAALREATATLHDMLANPTDRLMEPPDVTRLRVTWEVVSACVTLERILADTAAAAEAYTRRTEARALEAAADRIDAGKCRECAGVVRAMADEIRGGR